MSLNRIEVFKIAQNLESQGIEFYNKAMEFADEDGHKSVFNDLAAMETQHLVLFKELEENFKDDAYMDSDDIGKYLDRQYHTSLFDHEQSPDEWKGIDKVLDIFMSARSKEVFSVQFYSFIYDNAKSEEARAAIKRVIEEEKGHVAIMDKYIASLGK